MILIEDNLIVTLVAIDRANDRHFSDALSSTVVVDYPDIFMKILGNYVDKAIAEYHNIVKDITKVEDLN